MNEFCNNQNDHQIWSLRTFNTCEAWAALALITSVVCDLILLLIVDCCVLAFFKALLTLDETVLALVLIPLTCIGEMPPIITNSKSYNFDIVK